MRHLTIGVLAFVACDDAGDPSAPVAGEEIVSPDPVVEDCLAEPMTLAAGTGVDDFIPLADGDVVTLVFGQQGDYHIDVGGEANYAAQSIRIDTVVTAIDQPTPIVISATTEFKALAAYDDAMCSGKFWGVRAIMDDLPPEVDEVDVACALEGQRVEITVTASEIAGPDWTSEYEPCSATSTVVATVALDQEAKANCE